jgi:hypothetical protein
VNAIRQACAHPLFRKGLVDQQALADVRERLSPARMADGFFALYRKLAGQTAPNQAQNASLRQGG